MKNHSHQAHEHQNEHANHHNKQHQPRRLSFKRNKAQRTHDEHAHHVMMPGMEHLTILGPAWKVWTRYSILVIIFLFYTFMMIAMPSGEIEYALHWGIWLPFTSYIIFFEGKQLFKLYPKLMRGEVNMYTLIGLAAHLIYLYCLVNVGLKWNVLPYQAAIPWEAPALVIVVAMAGDYIESNMHANVTKAASQLHQMREQSVLIWRDDAWIKTALKNVKVNDLMQVASGDIVLLDAKLISAASFDYANITGEAKPQQLRANEAVLSGAFNLGEVVQVRVTKLVEDATLFKIVDRFFEAALAKPSLQRTIDKVMKYFVISVLLLALITFIVWLTLGLTNNLNLPWNANVGRVDSANEAWRVAVEVGVTVLAIACPCALGMATPIISLITARALQQRGVIINNAAAIENINQIKMVAFDKTGTLTESQFEITKHNANEQQLAIAKSLEHGVKHPIAAAFNALGNKVIKLTDVKAKASVGVSGTLNDKLYELKAIDKTTLNNVNAQTLIGLFENNVLVAEFALSNPLRPDAKVAIAYLKSRGIKTLMLTGDQASVAQAIANELGLDEVHAKLSPNDKLVLINQLRKTNKVLFVGDGFNDALASQAATISAAFASGSDIVNNASDFSLTTGHLGVISNLFALSKTHIKTVKVSLMWAVLFNVIALPIAVLFLVPPWAGALLMTLSNLLVVANALVYQWRLKRKKY